MKAIKVLGGLAVLAVGVGVALAWAVATHFVWNAPWWRVVADALMNVP